MIHHRSAQEVKWFDIIKLIILIVLIILLLLNWFSGRGTAASTGKSGGTAAATVAAQQVNPTATKPPATPTPVPNTPTPTSPALVAPTLNLPGGLLTPGEVMLTGTGTPGSQVAVVVDGKAVGSAIVGADGAWSLAVQLTEAKDYTISAQALDASGKVAAESEKATLTVAAPPTPTPKPPTPTPTAVPITPPTVDTPGDSLVAGKVSLTGTGEPGSEVEVLVDGKVVGTAKVGRDGKWSYEADLPKAGDYEVSVQTVDAGGKVLAASEPVALTVVKPITPPTLDKPRGDLTAGKVSLTGTGEPGSEVEVLIDGKVVGMAKVGRDGKWSYEANLPKAGDYEVSVQTVDAGGKVLAASKPVALTVVKPITPPTVDTPGDSLVAGKVSLTGAGEPGSEVEVLVDGKVVGTAKVGRDGKWSYEADLPKAGDYEVSVQTVDAGGKVLAASKPVALTVVKPITPPTLDKPRGDLTAGKVSLTGAGEPGSEVEVLVDGKVVGTAKVGRDGKWSYEADLPKAGDYEVSVQTVDAGGKVLAASEPVALTVVKPITPPTLDKPRGDLTAGKVTLTGTGEPGSQVVILINGQEAGQVTVGKDGKWSFTSDLPKAGDYEVQVQMVDKNGQVVAESKSSQLTVAKAPVIAPTLDKPAAALVVGPIELTGRGEPNSEVVIVIDGKEAGQAKVNARGRWNFTTDFPQAGEYEVKVQAVDEAGQILAESRGTRLAIAAPTTPCSEIYTVQKDDWLTKLALKYYNEMFDYPLIVEATNAKAEEDSAFVTITNPDLIEIGQQLCIPEKP